MLIFTSLERIRNGLDDIFVFKEPEKELKEDSMGFLYTMLVFMSLERIGNGLEPLILGFKRVTKVS